MQTERKRLGGFLPCLERGCLPCECLGAWAGSAKLSDLEATNVFSFNIQMYLRSTWCRSICWTSLCSQAIQCCSAIYLLQMHVLDFFIVAIIAAPGSCKYCSSQTQLKCRSPLRLMFEMLSFCLPSKVFLQCLCVCCIGMGLLCVCKYIRFSCILLFATSIKCRSSSVFLDRCCKVIPYRNSFYLYIGEDLPPRSTGLKVTLQSMTAIALKIQRKSTISSLINRSAI